MHEGAPAPGAPAVGRADLPAAPRSPPRRPGPGAGAGTPPPSGASASSSVLGGEAADPGPPPAPASPSPSSAAAPGPVPGSGPGLPLGRANDAASASFRLAVDSLEQGLRAADTLGGVPAAEYERLEHDVRLTLDNLRRWERRLARAEALAEAGAGADGYLPAEGAAAGDRRSLPVRLVRAAFSEPSSPARLGTPAAGPRAPLQPLENLTPVMASPPRSVKQLRPAPESLDALLVDLPKFCLDAAGADAPPTPTFGGAAAEPPAAGPDAEAGAGPVPGAGAGMGPASAAAGAPWTEDPWAARRRELDLDFFPAIFREGRGAQELEAVHRAWGGDRTLAFSELEQRLSGFGPERLSLLLELLQTRKYVRYLADNRRGGMWQLV